MKLMINCKYKKTVLDFEKWYKKAFEHYPRISDVNSMVLTVPEEMQAGVYLKYFDKLKIHIEILPPYKEVLYKYTVWSNDLRDRYKSCKSRTLAIKSAIQKASEIREKQLNNST